MTIQDWETGRDLLNHIDELQESKVRAEQSISVDAQAQSMAAFIDVEQLQIDIVAAIDAAILIDQNAFDAL